MPRDPTRHSLFPSVVTGDGCGRVAPSPMAFRHPSEFGLADKMRDAKRMTKLPCTPFERETEGRSEPKGEKGGTRAIRSGRDL